MKKVMSVLLLLGILGGFGWWWFFGGEWFIPGNDGKELEMPLRKYDFDELKKRGGEASVIRDEGEPLEVNKRRKEEVSFRSRVVSFEYEGRKISGVLNIPIDESSKKKPAVIMIRGYADKEGYYPGSGSFRMADELTKRGFVTISIDFLGFGLSSGEATNMMEARFEKVPAVMDLIASVKMMGIVDPDKIGIWAHSNGGQIALSVLEVSGKNIPTVLWAPMTNPFPQSILDTASDLDDGGAAVINALKEFESKYDARRYAFENYYDWIASPILIFQGTGDEWCKVEWQEEVVKGIRKSGGEAELVIFRGDNHNLSNNWREAADKSISFFEKELGLVSGGKME